MTKGLRFWLYTCIAGVLLGVALLFGTTAQAADVAPKPETTTNVTEKPNGEVVTNTTSEKGITVEDYFAPGGILTMSIGGIFLIVREIKGMRQLDVQSYRSRAETAEIRARTETDKLAAQIERLEQKLDKALEDVETKHDEWLAEVSHRRTLEILLAQHGIVVPTIPA